MYIEFLHGLIDILENEDAKSMLYSEDPLISNDKDDIVSNAKSILKDESIIVFQPSKSDDKFLRLDNNNANRYEYMLSYKWVAVSILSWLGELRDIKIPSYLIYI